MQKLKPAIRIFLFSMLMTSFLSIINLYAGGVAYRIIQSSPVRVLVFFNETPLQFKSELGTDKKQISIKIPAANVADTIRHRALFGQFTDIYCQTYADSLLINYILKDKSGYNTARLPYSRAIMTEVFQWSDLTPAEDHYRTALLGLEDSIISGAKDELYSAVRFGSSNAAYFLGIIFLKEGKINSAGIFLKKAAESGCDIPDVYGALADISRHFNDYSSAAKYSGLFENKSGIKAADVSMINQITEDSLVTEDTSALANLKISADTLIHADSISKNAETRPFDSTFRKSLEESPAFPPWLKFGAYISAGLLLLLVYLYLRWRNAKLKAVNAARKAKFTSELEQQKANVNPQKQQLLQKYKSAQNAEQNTASAPQKSKNEQLALEVEKKEKEAKQESVKQFLADSKRKSQSELMKKSLDFDNDTDPDDATVKTPARVELALHLAEEQQKVRSRKLEEIADKLSGLDQDKLIEAAKRIGIEKGSLETKIALEKFLKDDKARNRLEEKFRKKDVGDNE